MLQSINVSHIQRTLPHRVEVVQFLPRQFVCGAVVALANAELVCLVHVFQGGIFETDSPLKLVSDLILYQFHRIKVSFMSSPLRNRRAFQWKEDLGPVDTLRLEKECNSCLIAAIIET